jgi:hypothetical protein
MSPSCQFPDGCEPRLSMTNLEEEQWRGRLTVIDLRALSPLKWQHVNPYGTFTLDMRQCLPLKQSDADQEGNTLPLFQPSLG